MATTRKPLIVNSTAKQIQELPNGDSLDGITNLTATGTITADQFIGGSQPTCLLTVPKQYNATGTANHTGGTNRKPISFSREFTNVYCTTSLASDATVNSGITSITVPSAGTYLVSAMIGGQRDSSTAGSPDQVRFALSKTGISTFPMSTTDGGGALAGDTYPTFIFGHTDGAEFHANFALPLTLNANDTLSVHMSHIGLSVGKIQEGYFSVTKLH